MVPPDGEPATRSAPAWAPFGWGVGLVALALIPGASAMLPCLRVLQGPLAALPLAVGAWGSLERLGWLRWPGWLDRPGPRFVLAFAVLAGAGQWYTSALRVSGDEPHYLLMAQSLWREHDLDLRDNFEREDFREHTPGPVTPHYGNPRRDGRPFPAHSPALPFLLAPVYALGGRRLCVVALALCGAALAHFVDRLARRAGADASGARLAWVVAVGPPAFFYGFHVYTELPSALAIAVALDRAWAGRDAGRGTVGALGIALLPWLHLKLMPAAAILALVGLWRLRGQARIAFLAVLGVAGVAFLGWFQYVFGRPTPFAIYGGVPPEFSEGSPLRAAIGLLLDRSFGLLPFAPVFVLALAAAGRLVRTAEGRVHLALMGALLGPVVSWRMWWGGQCPPARFLVPATAGLAVATALAVAGGRGLARWRSVLAASGFAAAIVAIAHPGALLLLNRADRPTRFWTALSGEWPLQRYLPSLVLGPAEEMRVAALWLVVLAALLVLDRFARDRDWADRGFASGALPIALAVALGVMVDAWARPENTNAAPADVIATPD